MERRLSVQGEVGALSGGVHKLFVRRKAVSVRASVHIACCPSWRVAIHYHVGNLAEMGAA